MPVGRDRAGSGLHPGRNQLVNDQTYFTWDLTKVAAREVISTVRAGMAPISRFIPLPEANPRPGLPPVLLVHGYLGHKEMLRPMARRLLREGFPKVERLGYPSTRLSIEDIIERIAQAATGLGSPIDVIGHSMGAVAVRAWLKCYGGARYVRRFVALGGPHLGTSHYRFVPGPIRPVMDPDGAWVKRLSEGDEPVPMLVVRARYDHQVFPPIRGHIAGTREVVLSGIGHNGLLWSRKAQDAAVEFLLADDSPEGGAG